jgi:hypothetical protein
MALSEGDFKIPLQKKSIINSIIMNSKVRSPKYVIELSRKMRVKLNHNIKKSPSGGFRGLLRSVYKSVP